MEYEEIRLLKQSDKSTVHLVREKGGSRVLVRKNWPGGTRSIRRYRRILIPACQGYTKSPSLRTPPL
nr:hypothetical protein [uncultured Acetatifactor sp.]